MKKDIVIFGSSGQAKVILDIIEKQGIYNVVGLIDRFQIVGKRVFGYKVLGDKSFLLKNGNAAIKYGIVAIGDNWVRSQVVRRVLQIRPDFNFITTIHPSALISKGVVIGEGTAIMAGSIINSDSKIGKHCIINTNSSIDHDNIMGNFVSVHPGVTTGGNVRVGDFSAICLGAKIIHNITIGEHSVVGAGSVVVKNIGNQSMWYGVPAKLIRKIDIGEKYL
ncbi:MAG: transferase [Firmicutes bacterium]|nr:transferase [Bacillota bacterium]